MCCLLHSDRLETKSFVSEISGRITKTIACHPLQVNDQKRTGLVQRSDFSQLRLEKTQTDLCKTDILELFSSDGRVIRNI